MSHETYRYQIPGITFLLPIFVFIVHFSIKYFSLNTTSIIVGVTAIFFGIHIPLGWFLYNSYRFLWIKYAKGYEKLPFIKMLREAIAIYPAPWKNHRVLDLTRLFNEPSLYLLKDKEFDIIFNPFKRKKPYGKNKKHVSKNFPYFLENLSDLFVFKNPTLDYARSISTVRYGVGASFYSFILSMILAVFLFIHSGDIYNLLSTRNSSLLFEPPLIYILIIMVSMCVMLCVFVGGRQVYASREYISRLTLLTIMESEISKLDCERVSAKIPPFLIEQLQRMEKGYNSVNNENSKIAVFDLDNTLIIGDIGEAVFAQLKNDEAVHKKKIPFTFAEYLRLQEGNRIEEAYKKIVTTMSGVPLQTLLDTTRKVLLSDSDYLELNNEANETKIRVPVPYPNPVMQSLLLLLKLKGFNIYVISASTQSSVEIVAREFFGIDKSHVFGLKSKTINVGGCQVLSSDLEPPLTIRERKANVYRQYISPVKPLITAGDSEMDAPLLNLADENGLSLWIGDNRERYEEMKKKIQYPENFVFLPTQ